MDGEYYSTTSGGYTWGLVGFFGRVNYAYAGRYLAEVSARYDGSSKFPSSSQRGFFPSASVGWRLSEEPWLKPHVGGWLDNFKIRASIGSLGNANIDPYQYLETMTASDSASIAKSSVIINGQNVPYTSVPSLIPDDITWEKVDHLQHRPRPRSVQQPAFVHRRLLPPQHHRPLHRRPEPPAGTRQRRALRQLRQPARPRAGS